MERAAQEGRQGQAGETGVSEPKRAADDYGSFMTALMGLEDGASLEGYSQAGLDLLREAITIFMAEFRERHPGHWD